VTTFLKRLLFDDDRLRERTLTELVRAFETGRMVAFVGSMATESLGYGSWAELVRSYVGSAVRTGYLPAGENAASRGRGEALRALKRAFAYRNEKSIIAVPTVLSLVREALDHIDQADPLAPAVLGDVHAQAEGAAQVRWRRLAASIDALLKADGSGTLQALHRVATELGEADVFAGLSRTKLLDIQAGLLFGRRREKDAAAGMDSEDSPEPVVRALFRELRVHRFATLNYDLEIEAELMVEPGDAYLPGDNVARLLQLRRRGAIRSDPQNGTRLSRLLSDGTYVESDVRSRERPDRLIDFAVGSAVVDRRIMHLHGRATEPQTMVVGLRDYDQLYRKNDPARVPFEHGQRILFTGNPILFVGVGMSEQEVTWTLQDFVSNNPYRRFAPTFLLWSTASFDRRARARSAQKWLKRVDFFRKFGVLTIFDEDLKPSPASAGEEGHDEHASAWAAIEPRLEAARTTDEAERRPLELDLLARTVPLLARACAAHDARLRDWGQDRWRQLTQRLETPDAGEETGPITLWETTEIESAVDADLSAIFKLDGPGEGPPFRAVVATAGSGKGVLAWTVVGDTNLPDAFNAPMDRRLIVNAGYALDSDFLLLAILRFVANLGGATGPAGFRTSRETRFDDGNAFNLGGEDRRALIIINGIERFFTVDGAPLSAELDHLFRRIARDEEGTVRWLFLGTPRIEPYFRAIRSDAVVEFSKVCPHRSRAGTAGRGGRAPVIWRRSGQRPHPDAQRPMVRSVYFSHLMRCMEALAPAGSGQDGSVATFGDRVVLKAHRNGAPRAISRVVVDAYVTVNALRAVCPDDAELAMEILRVMAFIGSPVEAAVLLHVPRVREALQRRAKPPKEALTDALSNLLRTGLLLQFDALSAYPDDADLWTRYGLHTAVAAELRRRVGVPLSESKLSTSFNMSLFTAQPVDSSVPGADIHDELGKLIDHLIGAYKDDPDGRPVEHLTPELEEAGRAGPHATAAMRAALALVRSYYSTTGLLTLECDQRPLREDSNGVLLEHAERLETMLSAFRKMRRARTRAGASAARQGPEPFFAEDLVWVLNELGVVYLAQGDLYGARRSFDDALQVNRQDVEFECRSHNWRRITMNRVLLEIERADLSAADEKLREIQDSIDKVEAVRGRDPAYADLTRFEAIRQKFGTKESHDRPCFDAHFMHEEVLMTALVVAHRGFAHHLRGHLRTAGKLYPEALAMLRRLGEHRAYAMFQRLYAQLLNITDPAESPVAIRLAVTASESVRQMDMAYHARCVAAHESWQSDAGNAVARRRAINQLTRALTHAATMDLYRLRVEAGLYLARLKLDSGDYESALEHAADALSVAARFGLTLRKISLRIEIGHILIKRGDRLSGHALIESAVETADRFGYQRAVEAAQAVRVEEDVPA
jgi:tetratricopeptide (TPR) repeat protein